MSIQAVSRIMETSTAKGSEYACLLALANYAAPDGTGAFPSYHTLAAEIRVGSARAVRYIRDRLLAKGLILKHGERSPYDTDIFDLVYEDGSNWDALAKLHPDFAVRLTEGKVFPQKENFSQIGKNFPQILVVVDSLSRPEEINNNKDSGENFSSNGKSFPLPSENGDAEDDLQLAEDAVDAPETEALLTEWRGRRIVGEHLRPIAAAILRRTGWREEVDDLFTYWQHNRDLRAGWVVAQLRALAALPADEPVEPWEQAEVGEQSPSRALLPAWYTDYLDRFKERWPILVKTIAGPGEIDFLLLAAEARDGPPSAVQKWFIARGRVIIEQPFDNLEAAQAFQEARGQMWKSA